MLWLNNGDDMIYNNKGIITMGSKKEIFLEFFTNKDDADYWLDKHLEDFNESTGWVIIQAEISFIREGTWRAGLIVQKGQLELELDL